MNGEQVALSISAEELLARYVLTRKHFRPSDQAVKPDAFIPRPHVELSVTRHLELKEAEIWRIGYSVATPQGKTLYGRADVTAADCTIGSLAVRAAPIPENPNHANIVNWPMDKSEQKSLALAIAAKATFVVNEHRDRTQPITPTSEA